jgi:outer membrane protein assembly factor BamB
MSTPSPVTDGQSVWAVTGTGLVSRLDLDGKIVWQHDLQKKYGKFGLNWGYGSSPLLFDGRLIVPVLHGMTTDDPSYVVAFDPKDGSVLWKVERPTDAVAESPDAYCTPVPLVTKDRTEIVILGGDYLTGHDPKTGKEIWRCAGVNPKGGKSFRAVATPVVVDDLVLACVRKGPIVACRAGGQGTVTDTHTAWKSEAGTDVPSLASDGKHLYVVDDGGLISCLDPKTGAAHYKKERLPRGTYSASPVVADGKVYVTSESGRTAVVAAGPEFKILSENPLDDDYTLSSIAISGKELFLRTSTHLYCIGK